MEFGGYLLNVAKNPTRARARKGEAQGVLSYQKTTGIFDNPSYFWAGPGPNSFVYSRCAKKTHGMATGFWKIICFWGFFLDEVTKWAKWFEGKISGWMLTDDRTNKIEFNLEGKFDLSAILWHRWKIGGILMLHPRHTCNFHTIDVRVYSVIFHSFMVLHTLSPTIMVQWKITRKMKGN